jgi:hypothetical protein
MMVAPKLDKAGTPALHKRGGRCVVGLQRGLTVASQADKQAA